MASRQHLRDLPYAISHFIHMYGMRQGCIQLWVCWSQFVPLHPGCYLQIQNRLKKLALKQAQASHMQHTAFCTVEKLEAVFVIFEHRLIEILAVEFLAAHP
jgi:hypothetical protein